MANLGTLSLDFLVNLQNSMNQIGQLENRIEQLESSARDARRAVDDIGDARPGNLASSFDSATEGINKFRDSLSNVLSGQGGIGELMSSFQGIPPQALAAAAGFAAVTAGVVGLGIAVSTSLNSIREQGTEIAKTSAMTGVSTTALQEMRYAAQQSGVDVDLLTDSFKEMNNRLKDVEDPGSEVAKVFKHLGISVKDSSGNFKSADQILVESADTFKNLKSDQERAALASIMFGEEAAGLAPLLAKGSEGIDALRAKAQEMGIVLGEDAIDASVKFNQQMENLSSLGNSLKLAFGEALLPAATLVVEVINEMFMAFKAAMPEGTGFKDLMLDMTRGALRLFISFVEAATQRVAAVGKMMVAAAPIIGLVTQNFLNNVQAIRILINVLDVLRNVIQGAVLFVLGELVKYTSEFVSLMGDIAANIPGLESLGTALQGAGARGRQAATALRDVATISFDAAEGDINDIGDAWNSIKFNADEATKSAENLGRALEGAGRVDLSGAKGILGTLGEGGEVQLKTDNKTQTTLESILGAINEGNDAAEKRGERARGAGERPEKLTTQQTFEKLTGSKLPKELEKDPSTEKVLEEYNKKRIEAEKELLERQKQIDASLQKYDQSIKNIDKTTNDQNDAQRRIVNKTAELEYKQTELAVVTDKGAKATAESAKTAKELDKTEKELNAEKKKATEALKIAETTQEAFGVGFGGIGAGVGGSAGAKIGTKVAAKLERSIFDKVIAAVEAAPATMKGVAQAQLDAVNNLKGLEKVYHQAKMLSSKLIEKSPFLQGMAQTRSQEFANMGSKGPVFAGKAAGIGKLSAEIPSKIAGAAAGGGAGVAAGLGMGEIIGRYATGYDDIIARQKELEERQQSLNSSLNKNRMLIAEANISAAETVRIKGEIAELENESNAINEQQVQLARQKKSYEDKAGKASADRAKAQAEYAAKNLMINAEESAILMKLNATAEAKAKRDADINRILELREQMALNELLYGVDKSKFENASLANQIKILEIGLKDLSAEEKRVMLLEQKAAYTNEMLDYQAQQAELAKNAAQRIAAEAKSYADRSKAAKDELVVLRARDEIDKANLELSLRMQEIQSSDLTMLEKELEEKKALLDWEKKITDEKVKQAQLMGDNISSVGALVSGFGGLTSAIASTSDEGSDLRKTLGQVTTLLGGIGQAGQQIGSIATSIGTMAATGATFAGVMGAVTGGVGLIAGVIGMIGSLMDQSEEERLGGDFGRMERTDVREQAREFAVAFADEIERRQGSPVIINVDARGALLGEDVEVSRALSNLLEDEMGRRIGNFGGRL